MPPLRRAALLIGGCTILGIGVALILTADLGSDGFSTLVNGFRLATGVPFFVANLVISGSFLLIAAARRVIPGIGTIAQIVIVGGVASIGLDALPSPGSLGGQLALLALSLPVIGVGVACYLGSHLGAGPAEAAGLAWDPPIPFAWSYSAVQAFGAVVGWLLGATIGVATIAVILILGPLVSLTSRLLRLDVHQN